MFSSPRRSVDARPDSRSTTPRAGSSTEGRTSPSKSHQPRTLEPLERTTPDKGKGRATTRGLDIMLEVRVLVPYEVQRVLVRFWGGMGREKVTSFELTFPPSPSASPGWPSSRLPRSPHLGHGLSTRSTTTTHDRQRDCRGRLVARLRSLPARARPKPPLAQHPPRRTYPRRPATDLLSHCRPRPDGRQLPPPLPHSIIHHLLAARPLRPSLTVS